MYASFNYIGEIELTKKQAEKGSHSGQCDNDIAELKQVPKIKKQLAVIDAIQLKNELKEYGAWDDEDLKDHEENLTRILWLACSNIVEEMYFENLNDI